MARDFQKQYTTAIPPKKLLRWSFTKEILNLYSGKDAYNSYKCYIINNGIIASNGNCMFSYLFKSSASYLFTSNFNETFRLQFDAEGLDFEHLIHDRDAKRLSMQSKKHDNSFTKREWLSESHSYFGYGITAFLTASRKDMIRKL